MLVGDALRHGARGHAARLQQQDPAAIDQRRGYARGLTRPRRRGQNGGTMPGERRSNVIDMGINRQRRDWHRSMITAYRQGYSSACAPAYWRATARRVERVPGT